MSGIDYAIAREAARLRAQRSLKTPDALIIATALDAGISIVIANDARWASAIADAAPTVTLCHLDAHVPLWIGEGPLRQGRAKMSCVPTRRQAMWVSPSRTVDPYSKVARPSWAHVISNTPAAPWTPLTRRPGRKIPDSRSATDFAAAARKAAFRSVVRLAKSRRNRSVCEKVGMPVGQTFVVELEPGDDETLHLRRVRTSYAGALRGLWGADAGVYLEAERNSWKEA